MCRYVNLKQKHYKYRNGPSLGTFVIQIELISTFKRKTLFFSSVEERTLDMEIIVNPKTLDGGVNVIQLETAVGAAMKCFEKCRGINVPRSRFLPVKKTSDLFLIMSNLYTLTNGSLTMSPERMFQSTPLIKLGDENFKKVPTYLFVDLFL